MDRIREAVTKARADRPKSVRRKRLFESGGRFGAAEAPIPEGVAQAHCDFERFARNRIISNEQDPVLASFRILRTRVLQKMESEGWRTLAVISPNSGAGKTVTAINLAIAIGSKRGCRPLLVDLDFYRPSVSAYLGLKEPPSVLDFFEGAKALREVVLRPDLPDMLLIANERLTRRGAEYLTSPRASELIERGLGEFGAQVMIFDMSPALGCDDAIAFLPKVDCALMIAASGNTRAGDLRDAMRVIGRTPVIGTVLNKAQSGFGPRDYYY
jgi:Mrp family chromosome partitioning ATPase